MTRRGRHHSDASRKPRSRSPPTARWSRTGRRSAKSRWWIFRIVRRLRQGREATISRNTNPKVQPTPAPDAIHRQARIEASNVAPAESAVRLVGLMRQFEMLQKAITMTNDMDKKALARSGARGRRIEVTRRRRKMIRALYSAASGMTAQQMNVDNIANNLANSNTAGFKTRRAQFQDLLYQNMVQPGAAAGQQTTVPTGLATRPGNARRVQRNHLHAGRFFADLQSAGRGDSGQRILPGAAWPNGDLAYTRAGSVSAESQRQHGGRQRQSAAAADHAAAERAVDHHRHRRHRQLHAAGSDRGADGRPDPARRRSPIRPA